MICTIGSALKRMHNKVSAEIKQANKLFYKNKFSKSNGDLHKAWQVINELTSHNSCRSSVKELLSLNGVSITNSTALSNAFDDHFSTIGPKLACIISLSNGPSFQEFKYLWPLSERFQIYPH